VWRGGGGSRVNRVMDLRVPYKGGHLFENRTLFLGLLCFIYISFL
jgi:hypothetical protein